LGKSADLRMAQPQAKVPWSSAVIVRFLAKAPLVPADELAAITLGGSDLTLAGADFDTPAHQISVQGVVVGVARRSASRRGATRRCRHRRRSGARHRRAGTRHDPTPSASPTPGAARKRAGGTAQTLSGRTPKSSDSAVWETLILILMLAAGPLVVCLCGLAAWTG
jgi:hypothetical protein